MRHDGRLPDQLRPVKIERGYTRAAPGSVLIQAGRTTVLLEIQRMALGETSPVQ